MAAQKCSAVINDCIQTHRETIKTSMNCVCTRLYICQCSPHASFEFSKMTTDGAYIEQGILWKDFRKDIMENWPLVMIGQRDDDQTEMKCNQAVYNAILVV